jgi:Tfp pilus assembly protein PilF
MRTMRTFILAIVSICMATGAACAKEKEKDKDKNKEKEKESMDMIKANYYYSHLSFAKAIPYYEKIAGSNENAQVHSHLADCYRLTGDIEKAAESYRKALDMPRYGAVVMLRYGQMLMELGKYDEAAKWLKQYREGNLKDRRVSNLIAGCASAADRLKAAAGLKTPTLLEFNSDHSEFAPTLWNGHLVFTADTAINLYKKGSSWTGNACYNMYGVACADGNCSEEIFNLATAKDMAWHDGPGSFNADGDTMYFTRTKYNEKFFDRGTVANADKTVVLEIMMATEYDDASHRFRKVKPFVFNNRNYAVAHPAVSPSGSMLVFSSTMTGSGSDLYITTKNKKGKWLRPQSLGAVINTEGEEVFPYFANDTTLFFASDGHEGLGGLDIYVSHLDKVKRTFSQPVNVGAPINSSYDDISMALQPDAASGYFSSNRPAEKDGDNIYYYRKE